MKRQPTSKIILVLFTVLLLAVIAALFLSHHSKPVVTTPVSENVPLPTTTAQWPSAKVSEQTVSDKGSYYTINAVYPVTSSQVITGYFSGFVQNAITQFKSDTSWAAGDGANAAPAEADSLSLNITYTEQKNTNADNYVFNVDTYTGGAHDLESTKTFSFSATGQLITLATLFTNGEDGLKTIAPYVASQLSTMPDADPSAITDGTAPTDTNYQSFVVAPDSVTFTFDPYQVASYAQGAQTVKVPVSAFASIANTDLFTTQ